MTGPPAAWIPRALAALLLWGVLSHWSPARWPAALFEAGMLAAAACAIAGITWRGRPFTRHWLLAPVAAAAAWAWLQIALGLAVVPWYAKQKAAEWVVCACAVFLALQAGAVPAQRTALLRALAVFAALIAAAGLVQFYTSQTRVFWIFDNPKEMLALGPFIYRNKYAQFAELVIPVLLWLAITERRRAPLWMAAAALLAGGVLAVASRSGSLFLLLDLALFLALARARRLLSTRAAVVSAALGLTLLAAGGAIAGWETVAERWTTNDVLEDVRWQINQSSYAMLHDHWLLGVGAGNWPRVYPEYAVFDTGFYVNQAHNDWLQWTAEGGILLLALMLAVLAACVQAAVRTVWGVGVVVVLLHGFVDFPLQQAPAFAALVFSVAALAAGEKFLDTNRRSRPL